MSYLYCYGPKLNSLTAVELGLSPTDATNAASLQSETEMLKLWKRDDYVLI